MRLLEETIRWCDETDAGLGSARPGLSARNPHGGSALMPGAASADRGRVSEGHDRPCDPGGSPGIIPPTSYTDERRRLGDVIVELGFADRDAVEAAVARRARPRPLDRRGAGRERRPELRPARPGARRAQRPRLRRPERLRGRQGRGEPAERRRGAAVPGDPGRLHRLGHDPRRHLQPRQRARARRHRDDHRLQGAARGRLAGGHRGA